MFSTQGFALDHERFDMEAFEFRVHNFRILVYHEDPRSPYDEGSYGGAIQIFHGNQLIAEDEDIWIIQDSIGFYTVSGNYFHLEVSSSDIQLGGMIDGNLWWTISGEEREFDSFYLP